MYYVFRDNPQKLPSWRNGIRSRLRACAERRGGSSPLEGIVNEKGVQKVEKMDAHFLEKRDTLGRLAQLVRAAALHAVGQGFESLVAHHKPSLQAD